MSATTTPAEEVPTPIAPEQQHEHSVETREAYEYWGYLFKPDKTGTDKLKSLLRGLKNVMNTQYEPAKEHSDLTPTQLASFYRALHGNYDQLFLGTPSDSIAFIYKSLGCLYSLQPQSFNTEKSSSSGGGDGKGAAFTDPTVPALKTEGWIMWQTIQLLLGPDEHASFLTEAVGKWDVKDPVTGQVFPKILPRICFPREPDRHMVAWYEGVSERLRREAEEEERLREIEAERAEQRRLRDRPHAVAGGEEAGATDDEGSVDSKGPALAYFRNPLYRHVDGRPSIVRRGSKRPALSPRPTTMMEKGKEAASTLGHVVRNIGSPSLWDGRGNSRSGSRDRDRERRRRSLPDHRHPHHYPGDPPPGAVGGAYDTGSGLSPNEQRHRRRRSGQVDPPSSAADDEWEADEGTPVYSPRPSPHNNRRSRRESIKDGSLRHSRSHEPTPSQKEFGDYFAGYDDPQRRHSTAHDSNAAASTPPPPLASSASSHNPSVAPVEGGNAGGGFGPSASPLFATHVARQPQPPPGPRPPSIQPPPPQGRPQNRPRYSSADPYAPSRAQDSSVRRAQGQEHRPYSRSPDRRHDRRPDHRGPDDGRRPYDTGTSMPMPRRPRFEQSPAPYDDYDDLPPPPPSSHHSRAGAGGRPPSRSMDEQGHAPYPFVPDGRRRPGGRSGSEDVGSAYGGADDARSDRNVDRGGRQGRPKSARFADAPPAVSGVHGRRGWVVILRDSDEQGGEEPGTTPTPGSMDAADGGSEERLLEEGHGAWYADMDADAIDAGTVETEEVVLPLITLGQGLEGDEVPVISLGGGERVEVPIVSMEGLAGDASVPWWSEWHGL